MPTDPNAFIFLLTFAVLWGACAYGAIGIVSRRRAVAFVLLSGILLAPAAWQVITLLKPHPVAWERGMSLSTVAFMANAMMLGLKDWRLRKVWMWAFAAIALLAVIAMLVSPPLRGFAFAIYLAEIPVMGALRRRCLGRPLYEFPRKHAALLIGVGGFVLAAGLVSGAACLQSPAYRNMVIFPAGVILLGYSLMHRAGRTILRERGIEWPGRMIEWSRLRGYEWCDDLNGRPSLRLKGKGSLWSGEDVWIPTRPARTIDSVLVSHGIAPLYPPERALA